MKRLLSTALGLALFASTSAFAYDGYVTASVYLRAGPDSGYPSVARLHAGTSVVIEGCVDDWSWCDVSNHGDRGWVSADYLQHEYQGHRVLVPQYGVQIGIPIITFVFGSYWDDHYRSRSWYHDRDRYSHVTPHYGHAGGGSHYQSSGGSQTYQAPTQQAPAPAGQPRQSGTATPHPSYQAKPSTTMAPQQPAATQQRTQEKSAARTRPPVEHNKAPAPAPEQQHAAQQQQRQEQPAQQQKPQHQQQQQQQQQQKQPQQQKQAPPQAKSPPAQGAKDKGNQGQGKDQNKDQGGGKDPSKDQGGGKDHKDDGGGKDNKIAP